MVENCKDKVFKLILNIFILIQGLGSYTDFIIRQRWGIWCKSRLMQKKRVRCKHVQNKSVAT